MSNPKVFEFAKEVGLSPLALMDKIREWQLPVKSHMAELEPEMREQIRVRLQESSKTSSSSAKKTGGVRKKASSSAAAPPPPAPITTKKAKVVEEPPAPAKASAVGSVVRRKKAAEIEATKVEALKAEMSPMSSEVESKSAPLPLVDMAREKLSREGAENLDLETPAEVSDVEIEAKSTKAFSSPSPVGNLEAPSVAAKTGAMPAAASPTTGGVAYVEPSVATTAGPALVSSPAGPVSSGTNAPTSGAASAIGIASVSATPSAPPAAVEAEKADKKFVPRKKEVSIGSSGVTSEPSAAAVAVKRNIVGRMDLSRVTPPPRPGGGGFAPRGPGGPRPPMGSGPAGSGFAANRSKGNLRAGFVKAGPMPFEMPAPVDDFERKRTEDRKRAKAAPAEGAGAKGLEEQPQVFDAAEFRKREMVFQPKKKKGLLNRPSLQTQITQPSAHKRVVKIYGKMKLSDLAAEMGVKASELLKVLMKNGVTGISMNSELDFETIALVVPELGFEAQNVKKSAEELLQEQQVPQGSESTTEELVERPPVVTVMGHVDHGKTSLLDSIRQTQVAAGEAGGITQHIGAYQVTLPNGRTVTFLDTPGHEAFTAMRARGARVTDIAVIVVAADDGVMPQTVEAVNHARAAEVPLIIAVNKIDKPGANIDRIKQQLTEHQVVPEEWGGDAIYVPVSAIKKTGIQELLDQILLVAEVEDLKANPKKPGSGTVIEARLDRGRGSVATLLVQDGSIEVGQYLVAGAVKGRVRSLMNDRGQKVPKAEPGMPVEVLGLEGVPQAGDPFDIVKDDKLATEVANLRREARSSEAGAKGHRPTLEQIMAKMNRGEQKDLPVILKADVAGSLEALQGMFTKLATQEVKPKILHTAIGGITESDVLLASTAQALIIGFNVRPDSAALNEAKRRGVEIRTYSIVYELVDDIKKAMAGLLSPEVVEKVLGRAEVRNTFSIPKIGTIAGCFVTDGKVQRNAQVRLLREGKIVYTGGLSSLKRFKDDAREVAQGFECGIGIENYNDVKVGDVMEIFTKEEVARELTPAPSLSP